MAKRFSEPPSGPLRIGIMLRGINETDGPGVFIRRLCTALFEHDPLNHYSLLLGTSRPNGLFRRFPNVEETVLRAPTKLLWDQVAVPLAAWRLGLDVVFHHKFSIPLLCPCPTVVEQQGYEYWNYPEWYDPFDRVYATRSIALYCRRATRVLTISDTLARELERCIGFPRERMHTVPAAAGPEFLPIADQARLAAVRERYRLPAGEYLLMVVKGYSRAGRSVRCLYPGKNLEGGLRAYASVVERVSTTIPIVIAGAGVDHEALVNEAGLSGAAARQLFVAGFVAHEDMAAVYSMARALIFPSWAESFGIPILEAMACGCPVIASTTGACLEVAGDAAIFVDPSDEEAIAAAIEIVLTDAQRVADLRRRGAQRVRHYSWDESARLLLRHLTIAARGAEYHAGPATIRPRA